MQLYDRGAEEVLYHLKNNPVEVQGAAVVASTGEGNTDHLARATTTKISSSAFEAVKVVLEEAAARAGDVVGKGHDCAFHGGGGRAVHRIARHGLGRDVHVRGHRRGATRRA